MRELGGGESGGRRHATRERERERKKKRDRRRNAAFLSLGSLP
jgi:hypothetical protein